MSFMELITLYTSPIYIFPGDSQSHKGRGCCLLHLEHSLAPELLLSERVRGVVGVGWTHSEWVAG